MTASEKVKVLWLSRHQILTAEIKALEKLLDKPEIIMYPYQVYNIDYIVENVIKPRNIRVVISLLPLTITSRLVQLASEKGFEVWQPQMLHLHNHDTPNCKDFDPDRDIMLKTRDHDNKVFYRHSRFMYFQRIKEIKIDAEPILPPSEKRDMKKELEKTGVVK
ncbi:MAG: hypothetical protein JHC26_04980 [Thermofilum sp.]|jgi:hypothetical protein|uniref:hypothetical protein n=1 Tax=Thermofilum sp. TaxID=1961369 RepID=UPI002585B345|nr:hypothetical protein [Thermofilum sp.]MCI4408423.1 hypothetical protein [Thermofilum sp.]